MANYQTLKAAINAVIKANGNKEITGTVLNEVLLAMVNSLGAGYQFAGVATPSTNPGTPDQKVFYIASQAGTYTNFGGAVVSDGVAIFEWNGTWTTETLDLSMAGQVQSDWTETDTTKKSYIKHKPNIPPSANVDTVPTEDSPNAVSSGGTYDMIVNTAATLFGDIQDATNVNAIESVDGKIYNDYQAGDIFFIVDNNVRKYRVALVAGTADVEHPVTISPVNFYYALNSADAINLSLTLKTVSTEQQSLSNQQKAQARSNIATIGYEAQTLTTQQKEQAAQNIGLDVVVKGDVQQSLSDAQKVQAQNNMMGKAYAPAQFSGLGKKVLSKNMQDVEGIQKNVMMQAFFQDSQGNELTNTVFVIQYDYVLGENITIPAGCTLEFDGGTIKGAYTLTGNGTVIDAKPVKIFGSDIIIGGTWNVDTIYSCWFDNVQADDGILKPFKLCSNDIHNDVYIGSGTHIVTAKKLNMDFPWKGEGLLINKKDTTVHLAGTIQMKTNSSENYSVVLLYADNITFIGGQIKGDKDTHDYETNALALGTKVLSTSAENTPKDIKLYDGDSYIVGSLAASPSLVGNVYWVKNSNSSGTDVYAYYKVNSSGNAWVLVNTNEWGHGLHIFGFNRTTIKDVVVSKCTGDGIYVTRSNNVMINNINISDCRRQGISLTDNCHNITIDGFNISNIAGTSPQSAIDIEPNTLASSNIYIKNGIVSGCTNGINLYTASPEIENVTIDNVVVSGNTSYGLLIIGTNTEIIKNILISNSHFSNQCRIANNTTVIMRSCILDGDDDVLTMTYLSTLYAYDCKITSRNHENLINSTIVGYNSIIQIPFVNFTMVHRFYNCTINMLPLAWGRLFGTFMNCTINNPNDTAFIINSDTKMCDCKLVLSNPDITACALGFTSPRFEIRDLTIEAPNQITLSNLLNWNRTEGGQPAPAEDASITNIHVKNINYNYLSSSLTNMGVVVKNMVPRTDNTNFAYENNILYKGASKLSESKKPLWWNGTKWINAEGATGSVKQSGAWSDLPYLSDVPRGYKFFFNTANLPVFAGADGYYRADGRTPTTQIGDTGSRPTSFLNNTYDRGYIFFDTTLGKPIWWTGDTSEGKSGWVDATGADMPNT